MKKIKPLLKNNKGFFLFLFLYAIFRTAYADWSQVPSGSMEPTIYPGDYLLINKTAFGPSVPFLNIKLSTWGLPERGDIITFVPPHTSDLFVKRVVGLPGDHIVAKDENIFINGTLLPLEIIFSDSEFNIMNESLGYLSHKIKFSLNRPITSPLQSFTIPEGKYFVMGDHRNNSEDSRYWGFVDQNNIMGRVDRLAISFASERSFIGSIGARFQ